MRDQQHGAEIDRHHVVIDVERHLVGGLRARIAGIVHDAGDLVLGDDFFHDLGHRGGIGQVGVVMRADRVFRRAAREPNDFVLIRIQTPGDRLANAAGGACYKYGSPDHGALPLDLFLFGVFIAQIEFRRAIAGSAGSVTV